jgi:hypothetical protein
MPTDELARPAQDTAAAPAGGRRDADRAKLAAQQRIETAKLVADAVNQYHDAADRIDSAQRQTRQATTDRAAALQVMRTCGLTVTEISDLTGLSTSRVQALLRDTTAVVSDLR